MRVCFVDPKGMHFGLNTGLGYLAAYLKTQAMVDEIRVFDFNNKDDSSDARFEAIAGFDVIGFSIKSFTLTSAVDIARRIKRPHNVLVAGGPHITLDGVAFLKEHAEFDYAIGGEGEIACAALVQALHAGGPVKAISGLIQRTPEGIQENGAAPRIAELDSLPNPDFSVFDSVADGRIYNYPVVTSRGCPYPCTYCCVRRVMGAKWIARSVPNIMAELSAAKQTYGISCFNIQDDNFSLDMDRAKAFCKAVEAAGLDVSWSCPNGVRADRLDEELVSLMRASRCSGMSMGIESGEAEEFAAIRKGESLDDVRNAVALVRRYGLNVYGNFIIGLPHATLESLRRSVRFAKKLGLESCHFNILIPFPGTEIGDWAIQHGRRLRDWREGFMLSKNPVVVFDTPEFPAADRIRAYYEANTKCNNYFALIDEHDGLLRNVIRVACGIARYDPWGLGGHIRWGFRNFRRILGRVVGKNS